MCRLLLAYIQVVQMQHAANTVDIILRCRMRGPKGVVSWLDEGRC